MQHTLESFLNVWKNRASPRTMFSYMVVIFAFYLIGIIVGAAVYPGGFTFEHVYTSYLGGTEKNPDGYIFYNTMVLITGLGMLPFFFYLYRLNKPTTLLLNRMFLLFGVIGCIGFAGVGVYHQDFNALGHQITTYLAFGGYGFAAFFLLILWFARMVKRDPWPTRGHFLWIHIQLFGMLALTIIFEEQTDHFLEWIFVFTVWGWIMDMIIIGTRKPNQ